MQTPRNKFACRFKGTLQMGHKVIIMFRWEFTLPPPSMFKMVFRDKFTLSETIVYILSADAD